MKVTTILLLAVVAAKNLVPAHAALRNVELQKVNEEDKQVEVEDEAGADESGRMLGRKGKGKGKKKPKNGPWKKDDSSSSDDQPCSVEPTVSKTYCMVYDMSLYFAIVTYLANNNNHKILPTYTTIL